METKFFLKKHTKGTKKKKQTKYNKKIGRNGKSKEKRNNKVKQWNHEISYKIEIVIVKESHHSCLTNLSLFCLQHLVKLTVSFFPR